MGVYSFYSNGCSHNKTFSAILAATRDEGLAGLFEKERMGRLPLSDDVRRTELRFGELGFRVVGKSRGGGGEGGGEKRRGV